MHIAYNHPRHTHRSVDLPGWESRSWAPLIVDCNPQPLALRWQGSQWLSQHPLGWQSLKNIWNIIVIFNDVLLAFHSFLVRAILINVKISIDAMHFINSQQHKCLKDEDGRLWTIFTIELIRSLSIFISRIYYIYICQMRSPLMIFTAVL